MTEDDMRQNLLPRWGVWAAGDGIVRSDTLIPAYAERTGGDAWGGSEPRTYDDEVVRIDALIRGLIPELYGPVVLHFKRKGNLKTLIPDVAQRKRHEQAVRLAVSVLTRQWNEAIARIP